MATYGGDYSTTTNLETFRLLWLDGDVNNDENLSTQQFLRSVINHLETFVDMKTCQNSIEQTPKEDLIILIVSGQQGSQLVPRVHDTEQLSSIYVYCGDKPKNKLWADRWKKVRLVTTNAGELMKQILSDHKQRIQEEETMLISFFSDNKNTDQSSTGLNGQFVHFQVLIDVLLRIEPNQKDFNELIALCEKEYEKNKGQLMILQDFANNYSSSEAVWWYTKESFIYRMLNKALRAANIHVLFLLRFFIRDIEQQLRANQLHSHVQIYRGQLISTVELDGLAKSVGQIISMNSFFSTSTEPQTAMNFLSGNSEPANTHLEPVLFEITVDSTGNTPKPFANIKNLSENAAEDEVLLMLGSTFRVDKVDRRQEPKKSWSVIQMSLCNDDKYDLHELHKHMKKQYGTGKTNLLSFGNVLRLMGKFDLAEMYYRRFLHELAANDPLQGEVYYSLGLVAKARGKLDESLQFYQKALDKLKQANRTDHIVIGNVQNSIGEVYRAQNDHTRALESFKQAVALFDQAKAGNHPDMALFHDNIGIAYENQKNYSEAVLSYAKSLMIRKNCLPDNHQDLAISFTNIGTTRLCLEQIDLALTNLRRALDIRQKALPDNHPDIAVSHRNLGIAYEKKKSFDEALKCFEKAQIIYQNALSADHPDVLGIQQDIERVQQQLKG